jgi:hypothetical protein
MYADPPAQKAGAARINSFPIAPTFKTVEFE